MNSTSLSPEGQRALLQGLAEFHKINKDWTAVTALLYRLGIFGSEEHHLALDLASQVAAGLDEIRERGE